MNASTRNILIIIPAITVSLVLMFVFIFKPIFFIPASVLKKYNTENDATYRASINYCVNANSHIYEVVLGGKVVVTYYYDKGGKLIGDYTWVDNIDENTEENEININNYVCKTIREDERDPYAD